MSKFSNHYLKTKYEEVFTRVWLIDTKSPSISIAVGGGARRIIATAIVPFRTLFRLKTYQSAPTYPFRLKLVNEQHKTSFDGFGALQWSKKYLTRRLEGHLTLGLE